MTVIAGIDIGNATTEVVLVSGREIVAAGRVPTRGRKGSPDSLRGAAALVRRLERQAGHRATEARIAPLRPVDTSVRAVPGVPPATGRLRVLASGVATPGGAGACAGVPITPSSQRTPSPATVTTAPGTPAVIAVVPSGMRYNEAAAWIRALLASGTRVGAVLVPGDEGVLIANRLPADSRQSVIDRMAPVVQQPTADPPSGIPVIDQVDTAAAASCALLAVEVRSPGRPLTVLADPVALGAALGLGEGEAADAASLSRTLLDYSNAVVGLDGTNSQAAADAVGEPWVVANGARMTLRSACPMMGGWPPGTVRELGAGEVVTELDDLFAVDLAAVADAATARRGSLGRALLVAALHQNPPHGPRSAADELAGLLDIPVRRMLTEPAAARIGAGTTPGMLPGALVADFGAGTVDLIAPGGEVVVAGAGELLTLAVAQALAVPRAAADWIKRGPCVRVDGGHRFEAEDGSRGFLDTPAPPAAAGMLAVPGPGGLLPFGGRHSPAEWRAIRLRLKQAVLAASLTRALRALTESPDMSSDSPRQLLLVGGPAGDDELAGVLTRSLPETFTIGRGRVGGTLVSAPLGHRYAVAVGLAFAS
jgi:Diol dehydratase reactivase ATPase-like domain